MVSPPPPARPLVLPASALPRTTVGALALALIAMSPEKGLRLASVSFLIRSGMRRFLGELAAVGDMDRAGMRAADLLIPRDAIVKDHVAEVPASQQSRESYHCRAPHLAPLTGPTLMKTCTGGACPALPVTSRRTMTKFL